MKNWLGMTLAVVIGFAMAGCATEEAPKKAEAAPKAAAKVLDAKALQLVFKEGGGQCKWTSGATKGEDNYFATVSKSMGDADRYIGDKTQQGKWAIKGNTFCLNFGKEECSTFEDLGKKKYKATFGGKAYEMAC